MKEKIFRVLDVLLEAKALGALLSWPKFSITSFKMVSALARHGVVPATVIDVGANVGQFAVAAARTYCDVQIYSVEPHPDCFRQLLKNVRRFPNVTPIQTAVGDAEGKTQLRVNSHSHSSSILPLAAAHRAAFPSAVEVGLVAVKLTTLDSLFRSLDFRRPVLLKLDVQGHEAAVLRGAVETLKRVDHVVLEASLRSMYEGEALFVDLVHAMESQHFRFSRTVGSLSDPMTREILQVDALFERARAGFEPRPVELL